MTALSALEIQRASFPIRWRGWDPDVVRDFLGVLAEQAEEDARQRGELRGQIARLTRELEESRARTDALNQALVVSERAAERELARVEAEGQRILAASQALADRILEEAARRAENIEVLISQLRGRRRAARADLRRMAELLTGAAKDDEASEQRTSQEPTVALLRPRQREKAES